MGERSPKPLCSTQLEKNCINEGLRGRLRYSSRKPTGPRPTSNPWRCLSIGVRQALLAPLMGTEPWLLKKESFRKWVNDYYQDSSNRSRSPKNIKAHFPEWYFNHKLSNSKRNSLLCVQFKMAHERLWSHVNTINWIGDTGNLLFAPKGSSADFKNYLLNHGYGDWWGANVDSKWDWGIRSRLRGCQLHFRGKNSPKKVEVHIDIHNPGDPNPAKVSSWATELPDAISHKVNDDWRRSATHTPDSMRAAMREQGIIVPRIP